MIFKISNKEVRAPISSSLNKKKTLNNITIVKRYCKVRVHFVDAVIQIRAVPFKSVVGEERKVIKDSTSPPPACRKHM